MEEVIHTGITFFQRREPWAGSRRFSSLQEWDEEYYEDTLAAWEDEILKYEKATNSRLSDDVKIAVLMKKTQGQLQEHLPLNVASVARYHEVKGVVTNYIKRNRFSKRILQEA